MIFIILILLNSVFVEFCIRLRMWGVFKDLVFLVFIILGGLFFGVIVVICKYMVDKFKFVVFCMFWK